MSINNISLCKCGCNKPIINSRNRFIFGHDKRKTCIHGISPKKSCNICERELSRIRNRRWMRNNPNKTLAFSKKYRDLYPEKIKASQKKFHQTHPEARKISQKKYLKLHPEERKETNKKYFDTHKEKISEYHREYYQKNKEKITKHGKKYHEDNKEKLNKKVKKWRDINKEKIKEYRETNKEKIKVTIDMWRETHRDELREIYDRRRENVIDFTLVPVNAFPLKIRKLMIGHHLGYVGTVAFPNIIHLKNLSGKYNDIHRQKCVPFIIDMYNTDFNELLTP